ncbi:MAG TPA: oligopeptide ABC transporter substrate-binding protein [Bacillus sp. (in: firmicutes)]|uniref:oligopeptide ABC transporter substrate-binding protein n=1 Tax=Bacillus litorisediminis TaxID=2922713 RepID=UPI001FAFE634|nr:oligopeptide ABC transporter substrate-binding protein [Bacillus litorisediminis]HWO75040.1 oligopeptide ABC transporter substrate-binding protein [Bacillus sp. (in: firmicutes)]
MLVLAMFLAACSGGDEAGTDTNQQDDGDDQAQNEGPTEGGTVTYAMESEFEGLLDYAFYGSASDDEILQFVNEPMVSVDENLKPIPHLATWEANEDNTVIKFSLVRDDIKWHNGETLTMHDWVFALETLAHPDYTGPRYTSVNIIEGAEAFHNGEADSISGLEVSEDGQTLTVTFAKPAVNNLTILWPYPMSAKAFEGIPVAEMMESDPVRKTPVGVGPFKVTNVLPGEAVEMEAFDEYWQGTPHLDNIIVKVIDGSLMIGEFETGNVDISAFHPTLLPQFQELEGVKVEEVPGLSYYYIGFKMGTWDGEKNVMDENNKYANKDLRKAMLYALDRQTWIDKFFSGLGSPINRPMPTAHWVSAADEELPNQYSYDPEKAKQLLDEAGYVDTDGDGFREDPNGDKFVINFGHYDTGNPTYEARAQAIVQMWEEVGLDAELTMTEVNLYYDMLEKADPSVEVFYGGWGTGTDPDPYDLYANDALWNYSRWVNEENQKLLEDGRDIAVVGTDDEKRKAVYVEWQALMNEELPILPIMELRDVYGVNERVQGIEFSPAGLNSAHEWWIGE